jgi:hypothetical protein
MPPRMTPATSDAPLVLVLARAGPARLALAAEFEGLGEVVQADDAAAALQVLRTRDVHVLVCEDTLAEDETGLMFLARTNAEFPWLQRVLVCGPLEPDLLVYLINEANVFRVLQHGAAAGVPRTLVVTALAEAAEVRRLLRAEVENARLKREMSSPPYLVRRAEEIVRSWTNSLPRLFVLALLTLVVVVGTAIVVFVVLYLLKSVLGIDLIPGTHLRDWFR